ncbi:MAG: arylesterase [Beijerinckiaceae bacterium]|nr:arylesterase [Beijerinckiaceae bacterium]
MRSFHVFTCAVALSCLAAALLPGAARAESLRLAVLGDSLSAGYQLPGSAALPAVLERNLRALGFDVRIDNAGVSGDTASGGLERLDWAIGEGVDGVIVALGANDMLRGLNPAQTEKALEEIIKRLQAKRIKVLLVGMLASPSLGPEYVQRFNTIYPTLAERHGLLLYPFMLEGVIQAPKLNLPDGMHTNRDGVEVIAKAMQPMVERFVDQIRSAKP